MMESRYEDLTGLKENEIQQLLKLLYIGQGSPWLRCEKAIRSEKGIMVQGYTSLRGFYPDYIKDLDELVTKEKKDKWGLTVTYIEPRHYWHLSDAVEKFGFMLLAYDSLNDALERDVRIFCQYNFYCFVFLTKAFLDAISLFLNRELHLGMSGGQVDIAKKHFFDKLSQAQSREPLTKQLTGFRNWLSYVVQYRTGLIHRRPAWVIGKDVPRSAPPELRTRELHIPLQPDFVGANGWTKSKEIGEFVKEWLNNSEAILKTICSDCLSQLSRPKRR